MCSGWSLRGSRTIQRILLLMPSSRSPARSGWTKTTARAFRSREMAVYTLGGRADADHDGRSPTRASAAQRSGPDGAATLEGAAALAGGAARPDEQPAEATTATATSR